MLSLTYWPGNRGPLVDVIRDADPVQQDAQEKATETCS